MTKRGGEKITFPNGTRSIDVVDDDEDDDDDTVEVVAGRDNVVFVLFF